MVIGKYQHLAMRTSPDDGHDRILNGCMGLIGETGEIVDLVKKWKFQSGDNAELPKEKLIEECGDVLWYCAELLTGFDTDMGVVYTKIAHRFNDLRELNMNAPLEVIVTRLAAIAVRPSVYLAYFPNNKTDIHILEALSKSETVGIMTIIRDILDKYCSVSMEYAMDRNIEKLRKRYPDGFDPERSLHRDQQT